MHPYLKEQWFYLLSERSESYQLLCIQTISLLKLKNYQRIHQLLLKLFQTHLLQRLLQKKLLLQQENLQW